MTGKLSVLVVDDSRTSRQMLSQIVSSASDMRVVGEAVDGYEAVEKVADLHPDVILMDIVMPRMDGLEATRRIMFDQPTPIVLVSASLNSQETDVAFQAIKAGALTVLPKPNGPSHTGYAGEMTSLLNTLRSMASVRVIHHRPPPKKPEVVPPSPNPSVIPYPKMRPELVAIVASTGGPAAISEIVRQLPRNFGLPVVIVQHIASDFVSSLVGWLAGVTSLKVEIAQQGGFPNAGTIYIAPGKAHLRINGIHCFDLDTVRGSVYHMPSGDMLLTSVAKSYGPKAVGIVLTGMGDDGARGLKALADTGAFTIAQDQSTSVVYGMPQEAARYGAARVILPLNTIPQVMVNLSHIGEN